MHPRNVLQKTCPALIEHAFQQHHHYLGQLCYRTSVDPNRPANEPLINIEKCQISPQYHHMAPPSIATHHFPPHVLASFDSATPFPVPHDLSSPTPPSRRITGQTDLHHPSAQPEPLLTSRCHGRTSAVSYAVQFPFNLPVEYSPSFFKNGRWFRSASEAGVVVKPSGWTTTTPVKSWSTGR
jgi:hypothetical protein